MARGSYNVRGPSPQEVNWAQQVRVGGRYESPDFVGAPNEAQGGALSALGIDLGSTGKLVAYGIAALFLYKAFSGHSGAQLDGFGRRRRHRRRRKSEAAIKWEAVFARRGDDYE